MIQFLIKKFVSDYQNTNSSKVRFKVCRICTYFGICLNLFLFISKYLIGVLVNSVSIKADGINNLSDAGTNIISLISFRLAEKPADKGHPFGHERTETIASLFAGVSIVILGWEMLKQSIDKVLHPEPVDFSFAAIFVLCLSIVIKMIMFLYNRKYGKKYNSSLLSAAAVDSRSDMIGTSAVLASTVLGPIIHFNLDGYMGVVVSGIIFYSAYDLLKGVINDLIGEAPDPKMVHQLIDDILKSDEVLAVHDVIIHSYGPNSVFATAHAEVDGHENIIKVHDAIDKIERKIKEETGIELTIHIDPMLLDDPQTKRYLSQTEHAVKMIDPNWQMHDFHVVDKPKKVELYFDLVVPFEEKRSEEEIQDLIMDRLYTKKPVDVIINLDHPYD